MPENEYQIIDVQELTILDAAGNPVQAYRIYFTWGLGRKGHIEIVKTKVTSEEKERLITEEIDRQELLFG